MPRKAREISPTDFYHVMMRGINKEKIFPGKKYKGMFLEIIQDVLTNTYIQIVAYCVMDNHIHLVLKGKINDISKALKKVNTRYAMRYNNDFDRVGHVFQGRYKSEIIKDTTHLLQAIRYVHANPIKAGLIGDIDKYSWSSYKEYLEDVTIINSEAREFILDIFNGEESYKNFHEQEDFREFLDTKEEVERNRYKLAQRIISEFCISKGILDSAQIKKNPELLNDIIKELLTKTKLSHRKIAGLLEVNNNLVHKISLKSR
ncbi:MAG: transposase [Clostridia bacterium]|nr:transposase [Clostridia bacterium]